MTTKKPVPTESKQLSPRNHCRLYEIKIRGLLDDHWQQWFEGMTLKRLTNTEEGQACTLISGPIPDQPALHGLLAKIGDLNLILISVQEIDSTEPSKQAGDQNDEHAV